MRIKHTIRFLAIPILISFCAGCQSNSSNETNTNNEPITTPTKPTTPSTPTNEDKTEYEIIYSLNGGILDVPNPTSYTRQTETFTLNNPHKENYYFIGWSSNIYSGTRKEVTIEKGSYGDLFFIAKYEYIGEITYYNGSAVSLLPKEIKEYVDLTNVNEKAKYLYRYHEQFRVGEYAKGVLINFPNPLKSSEVIVNLYSDEECTTLVKTKTWENPYELSYGNVSIFNLIPNNRYFVKVFDKEGNLLKEDNFYVADTFRAIRCGNIDNIRDIGGKVTEDGITISYGRVFRSPGITKTEINSDGVDVLVNELGIKTEIDFRVETYESCHESININHCIIQPFDCLCPGLNENFPFTQTYKNGMRNALMLFTEKENYPIDFHCLGGADRTGTFAFILEGLLGVDYETICVDYELTSFYKGRRWRSNIVKDGDNYYFDDSGVMSTDSLLSTLGKTYKHILNTYGTGDNKFSSAVAKYLKTVFELTDENIAAIKRNILQ